MGKLDRKIEKAIFRGLIFIVAWVMLAPFKLLRWFFLTSLSTDHASSKQINKKGYVVLKEFNELEHRYIARKLLGRELNGNEIIHHINGRKTDNSVNNLCLMNNQKHEYFHGWLRWKKEKTGKYPAISYQKRVLQDEYGGILLEKVNPLLSQPAPDIPQSTTQEADESKEQDVVKAETFFVRRNKASQKLFLELEEEALISPKGKVIEIDSVRFEEPEEVTKSNLTLKQIEVYNNTLKVYEEQWFLDKNDQDIQRQLFLKLKKERLRLARKDSVPAYMIFRDTTLMEMAEIKPESEALMLQIQGVGPAKMERYGHKFMSIIKTFKANLKKTPTKGGK